ncbi:MAG TPA: T9SS type A sorting domain-containing protein [Candidatus Kryptonia bacterium]
MKKTLLSSLLLLLFAQFGDAQAQLWTIHDRYVYINNYGTNETAGSLQIEVGPPWVTTGGTTRIINLIPYDSLPPSIPLDSVFNYLQSDTITLEDDTSRISFTWGFTGVRLDQFLQPDSVVKITYEICDAKSGVPLYLALQTMVGIGSIPVFDTLSGQYIHMFEGLGVRVFHFSSYNGEKIVTKCGFNFSSLKVSSDSTGYKCGFVSADYGYPDSSSYYTLCPFLKDTLGPMMTNLVSGIRKPIGTTPPFLLAQNYPNPFNPSTVISYELPTNSIVVLKVFDVLGREAESLVNGRQTAGNHSVTFNASNLPSGVYFYRLSTQGYVKTMKMILCK